MTLDRKAAREHHAAWTSRSLIDRHTLAHALGRDLFHALDLLDECEYTLRSVTTLGHRCACTPGSPCRVHKRVNDVLTKLEGES